MRAIALDPNSPFAITVCAFFGMVNRADEGLQQALNALQLDRFHLSFGNGIHAHYWPQLHSCRGAPASTRDEPQYTLAALLAGNTRSWACMASHKHFELATSIPIDNPRAGTLAYGAVLWPATRAQSILADCCNLAPAFPYYLARVFASLRRR